MAGVTSRLIDNQHNTVWLTRISCLVAILVGLGGCGQDTTETAIAHVRPVKLYTISGASDVRSIRLPAVIEAKTSSDLGFQVGGILDKLNAVEGMSVTKGQVLARLNQRDYNNAMLTAKAQFDSTTAEFERASRLLAENAIAKSIYDQRKTQLDVAAAQFDVAKKQLEDTVLRSPFTGAVAKVFVEQYVNIAPNQKILTLQTVGAAEAVIQVPARIIANSHELEPLAMKVSLDAAPGIEIPVKLISISNQADPQTQTFETKFEFTPPDNLRILPGMTGTIFGDVAIHNIGGVKEQPIKVPLNAIVSDGSNHSVWVLEPSNMTVSKRKITIVPSAGDFITVQSGLALGERVVAAGASYLYEGMQVSEFR